MKTINNIVSQDCPDRLAATDAAWKEQVEYDWFVKGYFWVCLSGILCLAFWLALGMAIMP